MTGAPFVSPHRLLSVVREYRLPGVRFLPIHFKPTFDKWSGQLCGGVSIHVTDIDTFRSYQTTVTLIRVIESLWPDDFAWLPPPYEYETLKSPIDIISGDGRISAGTAIDDLCRVDLQAWQERTQNALIYSPF
jgi:uncharacterized protein YbbC (DUF1343 family)